MKNVRVDSPEQVAAHAQAIYQQVVVTKIMPMNNATGITDEPSARSSAAGSRPAPRPTRRDNKTGGGGSRSAAQSPDWRHSSNDRIDHGLRPDPKTRARTRAPFSSISTAWRWTAPAAVHAGRPLAPAAGPEEGPHAGAGRRQGGRLDGAGARSAVAGRRAAVGAGRHALRPHSAAPRGRAAAHRDRRGRAPRARRRRAAGRRAHARADAGPHRRRPGAVPDLGRRLVAAGAAGRRPDAGRQAAHQQATARQRRRHRRDELRAQAPVAHQGRPAGRRLRAGPRGDADHQRRAGRRRRRHRQRPDGARRHHLRRRAGHPRSLRHRGARAGACTAGAAANSKRPSRAMRCSKATTRT
jgi:hypothetical protein